MRWAGPVGSPIPDFVAIGPSIFISRFAHAGTVRFNNCVIGWD